jgi:hypothetical protein
MGVLEIISIFGGGVFVGYLFKSWSDKLTNKVNLLREIKDKNDQYEKIYQNVIDKKSRFKTRVNNTVYIGTKLSDYGRVVIVYHLDKNDIVIFKDDKCIMTSDSVSKELVDKIIKEINYRHGYRIDDIVEVLGLIFYRPDFEKNFNVNFQEIKERAMRISREMGEMSDIDKINKRNKVRFDIDEILDKINKVGIENLTNEEKEFLNNFNK